MSESFKRKEPNRFTINELMSKRGKESLNILNEIEFFITNASTIPLTSKLILDAEYLFSLTEKFREIFPKEIEHAENVLYNVEEIASNAEEQASMIIEKAKAKAQDILNESRMLKEAQEKANILLKEAEGKAERLIIDAETKASELVTEATNLRDQIENEAEEYVYSLFNDAEEVLRLNASSIKNSMLSIRQ